MKLLADENISYEGKLHWAVFGLPAVALVVTTPLMFGPNGIAFPFLIAAAWAFMKMLDYRSSRFVVTNKRVVIHTGWMSRNRFDMLLSKIETLDSEQSFGGIGTVTISGTGGAAIRIKNMRDPEEFKHAIQQQIH